MEKYKWITTLLLVVLLIGAGALLLWRTGFFAAAASLEGIQSYFEKFSPYSKSEGLLADGPEAPRACLILG